MPCHGIMLPVRPQVFVANPNKTQPIIDILAGNKDKLLRYLKDFHADTSAHSLCHVGCLPECSSAKALFATFNGCNMNIT